MPVQPLQAAPPDRSRSASGRLQPGPLGASAVKPARTWVARAWSIPQPAACPAAPRTSPLHSRQPGMAPLSSPSPHVVSPAR